MKPQPTRCSISAPDSGPDFAALASPRKTSQLWALKREGRERAAPSFTLSAPSSGAWRAIGIDRCDEHSPRVQGVSSPELAGDSMGSAEVSFCPFTELAKGS